MSFTIVLASAASAGHAALPLSAWLPAIAMIGGIVILGSIMMVIFHRREKQLKALSVQIASDLEEARALRGQLEEVHTRASNMMVAAQRLSARLDERMAALDMASLRMSATRNALPRAPIPTPTPAHVRPRSNDAAQSEIQIETIDVSSEPAFSAAASPALRASGGTATATQMRPMIDPLTRQIYELADAGRPPLAIARDLNEQVGKIELILALRQR